MQVADRFIARSFSVFCGLLFCGLSLSALAGQENLIRVGPDESTCDFTSLAPAIQAAGSGDVIALSGPADHYRGNTYNIFNRSLTIRGGYSSCTAAEPTGRTTLDADGQGRVIDIWVPAGEEGPHQVVLENLVVINGQTNNVGAGILVEGRPGHLSVTLNNVRVADNSAEASGGGIAVVINGPRDSSTGVDASLILITDAATSVEGNVAGANGGGIACFNPSSHNIGLSNLMVIDRSNVIGNQAVNGGGFSAVNCGTTQWYSGGSQVFIFPDSAITLNTASERGGGIYLGGGTRMFFRGTAGTASGVSGGDPWAARLMGNEAEFGGAAYLTGPSTRLGLIEAIVDNNSAALDGGAFFVGEQAVLEMGRISPSHNAPCQPTESSSGVLRFPRCSRLRNNDAGRNGGAIFVDSGEAGVRHTLISENNANSNGSVITVRGNDTHTGRAVVDSSLVFDNSGSRLFYAWTQSDLTVSWTTITDNNEPSDVLRAFTNTGEARLRVLGSIVHEESGSVLTGGGTGVLDVSSDCVMGHQPASAIFGSWIRYNQNDPLLFEKDETRPYFPRPTSPAIDFCHGSFAEENARDLAGRIRGSAHVGPPLTNPPSWSGTFSFDIGAYETNWPMPPDEIFHDRFEPQ